MKNKRTTTIEKTAPISKPAAPEKSVPPRKQAVSFFERENLWWMLGGAVLIVIGFILMAGGRNEDPNVFDTSKVYSPIRITIAPLVILAGFVVEIYALFRTPKEQ